ncbi:hypothetical protein [Actomonas aquatica]|uniref:Porin n=1 Tax=Actomonas aquatica TaxID=2866162 RepID=A0ABZ1CCY9_9BACT|nr:hypothetical protein [Opitutus sp. WL0086]WRQ89451.1 hypothetical protein K1X11_008520 [Opitutus sp. WL0086]
MNTSRIRTGLAAVSTALACIAWPSTASATVSFADIQVGGFISQGYLQSWGNNYPVEADGGTFDFREIALNASYSRGDFRIGAQAFAQSLGNYGEDEPILDWAVADYQFRREIGLRAGRLKFPRGLYGEALDVDSIRPYAFLPLSLYNPILRDFFGSFDGAMAYGNLGLGDAGSLDYKVFYGDRSVSADQGVADFFNNSGIYAAPGVAALKLGSVYGLQLFWNTPILGLRGGYSFNRLADVAGDGAFAPAPALPAGLTSDAYDTHALSVEYYYNDWVFAAEWQRVVSDFHLTTPLFVRPSPFQWSNWYVSAARRITPYLELGAYYSSQTDDAPDPTAPDFYNYNREWVASARFDLTDQLLVKIEGHWIEGAMNVFNTVKTPNPARDLRTTLLAVKTTYSF